MIVTVVNLTTGSGERLAIRCNEARTKYWNEYNIGTSPCTAGPYRSALEAYETMRKHRPDVRLEKTKEW